MTPEINRRWKLGFWLILALPILAITIGSTVFLVWLELANLEEGFEREAIEARVAFETILIAEASRLQTVASLSAVTSIAQSAPRRLGEGVDDRDLIEQQWEQINREHSLLRRILDNEAAVTLRRLRDDDPRLRELILTDLHGNTLAATDKPARYSYHESGWWRAAREAEPHTLVAADLDSEGSLSLAVPVCRPGRRSIVDGVLCARVDLAPAAEQRLLSSGRRLFVLLSGDVAWLIGGDSLAGEGLAPIVDELARRKETKGRAREYRYRILPVSAGIVWTQPARLLVARVEPGFPLHRFVRPALVLMFGILLAALIPPAADVWLRAKLLKPLEEPLHAGFWILHTALGRGRLSSRREPIQKELAAWFENLQSSPSRLSEAISEDMRRDMAMALEFQQAFLNRPYPVVPEVHLPGRLRLEFAHLYQPALAMGGDFFDITALANDTAGIFIGDVMGHGTSSALIVAMLRTLIAEQSRRGRNAPLFLRELNNEFCKILSAFPQTIFASAAYFVADTTSRIATYSVAGHPPPFHLHRSVGRVSRLETPKPAGVALGLIPGEEYGGGTVRLEDGDAFIFFTDGVYEATNPAGEEFGIARLERVLRSNVYRPSREILPAVMDAIRQFTAGNPLKDDVCLVAVDIRTDSR
ncbi:MAG: serine/threonine-protein phosphatase [Kiritimatiellae bacterium]|nr:serine/threonine-protein phosphatase [Kiritimatiellia bacterium]MDW8459393.1 PP2C family protein-serine/threonine phosphatase [Verrucomicrobiota bacterium]